MTALRNPHAVILAGPNGAGKSTLAPLLLAGELGVRTFVNADVIAQGLAGFDPASAAIQAGRIMLRRLDELRGQSADFAFETTLSGLAHQRTIRDLHASGYTTHLIYLWLPSPETRSSACACASDSAATTSRSATCGGDTRAASATSIGCIGRPLRTGGCISRQPGEPGLSRC